jgi:hypothetical protein
MDEYWLGLEVNSDTIDKVLPKRVSTIEKRLYQGNRWPLPTQNFAKKKAGSDLKGTDLIDFLKQKQPVLLRNLLLVTAFCKSKSNEFILNFIKENRLLTSAEIEKSKMQNNYDRVALVLRLFYKSAKILQTLYWSYKSQRRDFDPYSLAFDAKEFYNFLKTDKDAFQEQLEIIPKFKNKCYCWHILIGDKMKIYCMRGFPYEKIIHQVKRNRAEFFAKTFILKVFEDGSIKVPAGTRKGTLRIANALARQKFGKTSKFARVCTIIDSSKLNSLGDKILSNQLPANCRILELELRKVPIPGNPNVRFINYGGLEETIEHLDDFSINLSAEATKISKLIISIEGRPRELVFKPMPDDKVAVICHSRLLSDADKNVLETYFSSLGIDLNFGSETID